MRILIIISLLIFLDSSANCQIIPSNDSIGQRDYKITHRYLRITARYKSGEAYFKSSTFRNTGVEEWTEYYRNGCIKERGKRLLHFEKVGVWEYYSPNCEVDSIVDYDKRFPISYYKALSIAKKEGCYKAFRKGRIEVYLIDNNGKTCWEFIRWNRTKYKAKSTTGEAILVDVNSGQISKLQSLLRLY